MRRYLEARVLVVSAAPARCAAVLIRGVPKKTFEEWCYSHLELLERHGRYASLWQQQIQQRKPALKG
jgi:hypothetical protein